MNKLDAVLKIIQEDSVDAPSTSIVPSSPATLSNPPTNSEFTTLTDLLRYKAGMDVGETKNKILGVPLQNILEQLADFYVQNQELRLRFKDAARNPVYRDKANLKPVFVRMEQCIKTIETQIKEIAKDLDNLSLDK